MEPQDKTCTALESEASEFFQENGERETVGYIYIEVGAEEGKRPIKRVNSVEVERI